VLATLSRDEYQSRLTTWGMAGSEWLGVDGDKKDLEAKGTSSPFLRPLCLLFDGV
jgi:hypothetical protein